MDFGQLYYFDKVVDLEWNSIGFACCHFCCCFFLWRCPKLLCLIEWWITSTFRCRFSCKILFIILFTLILLHFNVKIVKCFRWSLVVFVLFLYIFVCLGIHFSSSSSSSIVECWSCFLSGVVLVSFHGGIPIHRMHVFVLLLHVPQCSFCNQLPLVPDTNDLDFVSFLLDFSDVLRYCLIVLSTKPWVDGFVGAPWRWVMTLSDAVVLAEMGHQRILYIPFYCQSCVFSEGIQIASKIETSIPIHLLLPYFSMDKAMNTLWNDQLCLRWHEHGRRW